MKLEKNQFLEDEDDIEILDPLTDEELKEYLIENEDEEDPIPEWDIEQLLHNEIQ